MVFFFLNDTATTEIYTLSLHDALPISCLPPPSPAASAPRPPPRRVLWWPPMYTEYPNRRSSPSRRSEEHTSELQSRQYLVCRLLLEKKKRSLAFPPST